MRIFHVLDHSPPLYSGYAFRTVSILREQRAMGWHTEHLTGPKQETLLTEEEADGLHFYRTPPSTGSLSLLPVTAHWEVARAITKRLEALAGALRPDVLHAHSPALNGLAAINVGKKLGLPVVYEVRAFWEDAAVDHGTTSEGDVRYRLTRALETHVLRRADHITTICEGLRNDIIARGISSEKVTVIPNAVHPERFPFGVQRDSALVGELGLAGKTVLGFVGSYYRYEGLDLLIDAMSLIVRARPDVCLLLVGGGPHEDALKSRVAQLNLASHVTFAGRVAHSQVIRYYSVIDHLIYPRRSKRITELVTPLKPLEAMALGKPLIASDVGGHRELITPYETGLLFRADDLNSLAKCVTRFLSDEALLNHIRNNARRYIEETRTWHQVCKPYRHIYHELVGPATFTTTH